MAGRHVVAREYEFLVPSDLGRTNCHAVGAEGFVALREFVLANREGDSPLELMRLCSPRGIGEAFQLQDYVGRLLRRKAAHDAFVDRVELQATGQWLFEGRRVSLRPGILCECGSGRRVALDTKWKRVYDPRDLSVADMHQMYAYGQRYRADGEINEVYNGPGQPVWDLFESRVRPKNGQYQVSLSKLNSLDREIDEKGRIPAVAQKRTRSMQIALRKKECRDET